MELPVFDDEEGGEMRAAWAREPARLCVPVGGCARTRKDCFAKLVKLARAAIVVAHELLGGALVRRRTITKLRGQRRLPFECESFRLASREPVQPDTHTQQKIISAGHRRALALCDVPARLQTCERAATEARICDPECGVQVAQRADALLHVRFLQIDDRAVFEMPRVARAPGCTHKCRRLFAADALTRGRELLVERLAAGDEACVDERRLQVRIGARRRETRAHRLTLMPDGEARVPEDVQRAFDERVYVCAFVVPKE